MNDAMVTTVLKKFPSNMYIYMKMDLIYADISTED